MDSTGTSVNTEATAASRSRPSKKQRERARALAEHTVPCSERTAVGEHAESLVSHSVHVASDQSLDSSKPGEPPTTVPFAIGPSAVPLVLAGGTFPRVATEDGSFDTSLHAPLSLPLDDAVPFDLHESSQGYISIESIIESIMRLPRFMPYAVPSSLYESHNSEVESQQARIHEVEQSHAQLLEANAELSARARSCTCELEEESASLVTARSALSSLREELSAAEQRLAVVDGTSKSTGRNRKLVDELVSQRDEARHIAGKLRNALSDQLTAFTELGNGYERQMLVEDEAAQSRLRLESTALAASRYEHSQAENQAQRFATELHSIRVAMGSLA